MPEYLVHIDRSVFLFLNGLNCPLLDPVFYYGTNFTSWIPLYLLLLFLVTRKFGWGVLWVVLFAALMVTASDQLSNFFKEWIARPRPTHEPGLAGVHTVNGYLGGTFGFYSAHASSNLAIAIFMIRILGRPFRFFPALMLFYAFFMAYSRVYLGVHYPGDIVAGWMAGALIGWSFAFLCKLAMRACCGILVKRN